MRRISLPSLLSSAPALRGFERSTGRGMFRIKSLSPSRALRLRLAMPVERERRRKPSLFVWMVSQIDPCVCISIQTTVVVLCRSWATKGIIYILIMTVDAPSIDPTCSLQVLHEREGFFLGTSNIAMNGTVEDMTAMLQLAGRRISEKLWRHRVRLHSQSIYRYEGGRAYIFG